MTLCTVCRAPVGPGGAKGMCSRHYQQNRRTGSPDAPSRAARGEGARISVRLTRDERARLVDVAKAHGMTLAEVVRNFLLKALL
jgi:hypothetical protein